MKILKSLTTFILIILLASCNVSSSSGSTSSIDSSLDSLNVSSIVLSTTSSVNQFIGLTSRVVINATLNSNASTSSTLEWYVNNELSATQTGLVFEFFPNAVTSYQIVAKSGRVTSNIITISVNLPKFNLNSVEAITNTQLTVKGDAGMTFAVSGISLSSTSSYNLANQSYTLNLMSPMVQGLTYNITASKPGFDSTVFPFLYETRKLALTNIIYKGQRVTANSGGVFELQKPFAGAPSQNYTINLQHTNLEGSNVPISIITNVPAGATAIAAYQTAINIQKGINITRDYTLTNTTEAGIYTHNISVNNINLVVRISVSNALPSLTLTTPIIYDLAATTGGGTPISSPFAIDADGDYVKDVIVANTSGQYEVMRPYNGSAFELTFILSAENFPTPLGFPSGANPYNIIAALSGPSGGVMYYGATVNALATTYPFRESTGNNYRITQYIDNKTNLGTYNYTFTATGYGLNLTRNITIVVKETLPEIEPVIVYGAETLKANTDGSYTIYKPLSTNTLNMTIGVKISNYESPLAAGFAGGSGVTTLYSDGTSLRYLLDTRISYSGPLSSVGPLTTKIALELGSNTNTDTTVRAQNGTVDLNRYRSLTASETIDLIALRDVDTYTVASNTNIFDAMKTISSSTFPGQHTYTVQIGGLSRQFIFRVVEPTPLIVTRANVVQYGPNGSETENNVTYKEKEDRYYVNGVGQDLKINIYPFGMATGSYPYTFTRLSPSGSFQSNTNFVTLTLLTGGSYDGTSTLPGSGAGSEMAVDETLSEEGEYAYSFTINGVTKEIKVIVLAAPQLRIEQATLSNEVLNIFNNEIYLNHASSSRFIDLRLNPINIETTYKYIINSTGQFPIGNTLTAALEDLTIVDGRMNVGISVPSSSSTSEVRTTYLIALYKGNLQIGTVTKLVVVSQPKTSTVFFATNGGTVLVPKTGFINTAHGSFTATTRTGYTFVDWNTNPALTTAYTGSNYAASDFILYAKWSAPIAYNITYDLDGGTNFASPPATYTIETPTIVLGTPTKSGSTFEGWFTTAGFTAGTQVTSIPLGSSGAITLYAKFNP